MEKKKIFIKTDIESFEACQKPPFERGMQYFKLNLLCKTELNTL